MYEELIKALRICREINQSCDDCVYHGSLRCTKNMASDAADAIEERDALLDGVSADNDALCETIERLKKPRWISVMERLPKEMDRSRGEWSAEIRPSDDVLVWLSHEKRQSVAWYSHTYNEWTTVDENTVYIFGEVTHWMPLPEPPKENEKSET